MTNVALVDVRYLDGEPWQVAARAGEQFEAAIQLALEAASQLEWSARGSWLSQEHHRTGTMPEGLDWHDSPIGRKVVSMLVKLQALSAEANVVTTASAWDPRSP